MRVISGSKKGHKLKTPKNHNVRPTEDRVKESIFNIIGQIGQDWIILDGFGGTGSIGIEFLSRGAKLSYLVDNSRDTIGLIEENLKHTKLLDRSILINKDIFLAIRGFANKGLKFDFIYLDPPFKQEGFIEGLLEAIAEKNILADNGKILLEHEKELVLKETNDFKIYDYRKYGSKAITFLKKF